MSGFLNNLHELHQQHKERREARHEGRGRGGHRGGHDDHDSYGHGRHHHDEEPRRPQTYPDQGHGYAPPPGPPPPSSHGPSGFASQGGLDRGDFASDADIERMVASGGELSGREERREGGYGYGGSAGERGGAYGRYDAPSGPPPGQGFGERANERGRYDAPSGPPGFGERASERDRYDAPSGPPGFGERASERGRYDAPSGQGFGERASDHGRYDAPSGPPPGRGYQGQQQGYGTGDTYASRPDRENQYGAQQTQGRAQYEAPQERPAGHGRGQGNAPAGGFSASRDGEGRYGSGYGGTANDRGERPQRGEASSYYDQPGQGDRYAHLANMAQEHGQEDAELYRRATHGLQERIQSQAQSRRARDDEEDYKAQVDAHRKAYGGDDHGPMDADTIGTAAAMEAFKQAAAGAPAGGGAAQEAEAEAGAAARGGGSRGLQDKLMALAMSHAGKLFDKKNAGSGGGGGGGDKAQAMQSAAATAMQLFSQYQSKGKIESGDMSKVIGLAMKLL